MGKLGSTIGLLLLLILPFENNAQDINGLLKDAQQLESAFKEPEALQKYLDVVRTQPTNLTALIKISELYSILGKHQGTKDKQKEYYRNARVYAQKALGVNPNSSDANVVMALAMGRMALISSGDDKVKAIVLFTLFIQKCLERMDKGAFSRASRTRHNVSKLILYSFRL